MPIYEYRCRKCGNVFEEWVKTFDSPACEPCPACGGDGERILSHTSFKLEGGGWFASCYGGKTEEASPASGKAEAAASSTSSPSDAPATSAASSAPAASAGASGGTSGSASGGTPASGGTASGTAPA